MASLRKRVTTGLGQAWEKLKLPLVAVVFGLFVGALAIMWVSVQEGLSFGQVVSRPLVAYKHLFLGVFGSLYNFGEATVYIVPLIFTGLSIAFAFRCGLFNIGAEGQYIIGTLAAAYVGFTFNNWPWLLQMVVAVLAAAVAGGLWAGIVGLLKAKRGVHEVITSIMLNYIALYVYNYLVSDPKWFKAPNFQGSFAINSAIKLPKIAVFAPSRAHAGLFIALFAAVIVYYILWKTTTGYEVRAVGHNADAAEYAGISVSRNFVLAMVISGMLAGLAGGVHLLGTAARASQFAFFPGYGFDGIAVSLIGANHPAGVVLAASLFGMMKRGALPMQSRAGIAKEVVVIVQAAIIFFVAADQIVKWILTRRKKQVKGEVAND